MIGRVVLVLALTLWAPGIELKATQICEGCPVKKLKTTRVRDGKWQTKIAMGAGVTIHDAELIVRAARRTTITNIDDPDAQGWPEIDANKLTQINQSDWVLVIENPPWLFVRQPDTRYFDVIDRSGRINVVGLSNGRLERVYSITIHP